MKKLWMLALVVLLTGCGVKVQTLYDHRVDFQKYKRFCWIKGCEFTYTGPEYLNGPGVKENFQQAIIEVMQEKGIVLDADQPDLLLDVRITLEDEKIIDYHRVENDDPYYRLLRDEADEIRLLKGTLIIDIADHKEGWMIWRSVAVSYMDLNPDLTKENIKRGVALALKKFPPQKKN